MRDLSDLDTWRDIISSEGWSLYRDLMKEHKEYLERQVLVAVEGSDLSTAEKYLARADECWKILQMVDVRLSELKKEEES